MSAQSHSVPDVVSIAASHLRTWMAEPVSAHAFAEGLAGLNESPGVRAVLGAYLAEADPAGIMDLVACGAADLQRMRTLAADLLPEAHPTREFLDGLA